jgi:hypothetical protein
MLSHTGAGLPAFDRVRARGNGPALDQLIETADLGDAAALDHDSVHPWAAVALDTSMEGFCRTRIPRLARPAR